MRGGSSLILGLFLLIGFPAHAQDTSDSLLGVETHGFVSQGFIYSTDNNYLGESTRGSFEFTEAGINFTKPLTDRLRVGLQLFMRDLGPLGNFDASFDWFYADYRFTNWFGLRAGRVKMPLGLYNDISDIDAARVPILMPQSIYPVESRDYLLAQTGGEAYGYVSLGKGGAIDYRLFLGTLQVDPPVESATALLRTEKLTTHYIMGGRVLWEAPVDGLRMGVSMQKLHMDIQYFLPGVPAGTLIDVNLPIITWAASFEYARDALLLSAEYGRTHLEYNSTVAFFPSSKQINERGYAMASYRVNSWFQPGAYYSMYFTDRNARAGTAAKQHDAALTLRFDINSFWLVKLEGHWIHGTAFLNPALNGNVPIASLKEDWGLFLVKTTASF